MIRRAGIATAAALASLALFVPASRGASLADHVHVFAGTKPGHDTFGGGHNFPGASVPFGMVQWSPDTTPADRNGRGGYDYRDSHIKGFSLTHLAGAGCSLYGDFPFLPTTEPLERSPAAAGSSLDGKFQPGFSHAHESGRPGYYSVRLNPVGGADIDTELTATTRTGMARFTFPRNPHASVLINAGGSAQPDDFAAVQIDPARREIDGTASSGLFCGQRPRYRVYIAAVFDRPFAAYGTWEGEEVSDGSTAASDSQAPPANPQDQRRRGRLRDLRHPPQPRRHGPGRRLLRQRRRRPRQPRRRKPRAPLRRRSRSRARDAWNKALGRIRVSGRLAARPRHLLHGALPRLPGAAHLQRRRRRLHRHGRPAAPGRGPHPVRRLLRLGHLPHADPAALDPGPAASERDGRARCSPMPPRAAACRAGPTPTARA